MEVYHRPWWSNCPWWSKISDSSPWDFNASVMASCARNPNSHLYGLDCHNYDEYDQCTNNCWWYSRKLNMAFTLTKDPCHGHWQPASVAEKDPTRVLQTIFANEWPTGQLLLENASKCAYLNAWYKNMVQGKMKWPGPHEYYPLSLPNATFAPIHTQDLGTSCINTPSLSNPAAIREPLVDNVRLM